MGVKILQGANPSSPNRAPVVAPHHLSPAKTHAHGFLQIPVANFIQSKEHVSLAVVLERTYVWTHDSGMLSISHADLKGVPTWKEGEATGQDRLGFESCH